MSTLPVYLTGVEVTEEVHEFIWKIQNHQLTISSAETLEASRFDVTLTSKQGFEFKFASGYKAKPNNQFGVFFRFVEVKPTTASFLVKWNFHLEKEGAEKVFRPYTPTFASVPTKMDKDLELGSWPFGYNLNGWADEKGTVSYRMRVTLVLPVKHQKSLAAV